MESDYQFMAISNKFPEVLNNWNNEKKELLEAKCAMLQATNDYAKHLLMHMPQNRERYAGCRNFLVFGDVDTVIEMQRNALWDKGFPNFLSVEYKPVNQESNLVQQELYDMTRLYLSKFCAFCKEKNIRTIDRPYLKSEMDIFLRKLDEAYHRSSNESNARIGSFKEKEKTVFSMNLSDFFSG